MWHFSPSVNSLPVQTQPANQEARLLRAAATSASQAARLLRASGIGHRTRPSRRLRIGARENSARGFDWPGRQEGTQCAGPWLAGTMDRTVIGRAGEWVRSVRGCDWLGRRAGLWLAGLARWRRRQWWRRRVAPTSRICGRSRSSCWVWRSGAASAGCSTAGSGERGRAELGGPRANVFCAGREDGTELGLFSLDKRRLVGTWSFFATPWKEFSVRWEPVSSAVPAGRGPEEMALSWDRGDSIRYWKMFFECSGGQALN